MRFRDGFAAIAGVEGLHGHIGAAHVHMPCITLARAGEPRQCQGAVLVDWIAARADGQAAARGTNYVAFSPRGPDQRSGWILERVTPSGGRTAINFKPVARCRSPMPAWRHARPARVQSARHARRRAV